MGDELANMLEIFKKIEKDGGQATLSISTHAGKTKVKLELVSSLSTTEPNPSLPSSPASGGRRRRHRGPAKKAKAKARAALHQATLASAADPVARGGEAPSSPAALPSSAPGAPTRNLRLLPSPPDGRRRVMSVGRREMPPISFLNLDGTHPPSPPINPWIPCLDNCHIPDEHCQDCFRCIALCVKHHGCTCDEDQQDSYVWCKQCMQQNDQN